MVGPTIPDRSMGRVPIPPGLRQLVCHGLLLKLEEGIVVV